MNLIPLRFFSYSIILCGSLVLVEHDIQGTGLWKS